MNRFGYSIINTRTIDYNQFDRRLLIDVVTGEPSFMTCMSCGGCTATCSAGNLIDFNIRRIGLLLRQGDTEALAKEIDKCMLCGKCILVCPRDINIRNVIMLIKKGIVKYRNN
jgi:heterodisulfide reductase subunit C